MAVREKVVMRFADGKVLKGFLDEFSQESSKVWFEELGQKQINSVPVQDLKAIFFVRSFEGDSGHKEKKKYGISQNRGRKIFLKFNDGETMVGFIQGDVPWDKGFFLSKPHDKKTGFFVVPADEESNNVKAFIIRSSVKDITAIP